MVEAPRILLEHHLKRLKLPTFLREYEKVARQCAAEGLDHVAVPRPAGGAGADRPRAPPRRAAYQAGPLPRRQTARELRLQGDPERSTRCWCWISPAASTSRAART